MKSVKPGSSTITVTAAGNENYKSGSKTYALTVNKGTNTLTLSATSGSMAYSTTSSFTVSKNTSNGTLSVSSSNASVATASVSGTTVTLTSKAAYGSSTITVTSDATDYYNSATATYALTVNKGIITLNNNSATSAGTAKIYQTYNTNVYLSNWGSGAMTTSANKITVPTRTGYTFGGYYDSTNYTTQYISADGFITSAGLTAGKALKSNGTWYAKWTANTYTITLDKNHADAVAGTTSLYTTYATGVYTDSSRTKSMTTSANGITKPTRSYTVTYDSNGGSVSTSSSTASYTFNGYYSATSGGTKYTGTTYILEAGLTAGKGYTSNATWYAQWSSKAVTLPTPTRTGYTFAGWYTAATGGTKVGDAGASYTPTTNTTLYAQWSANEYTVSFDQNGGTGGQTSSVTATYDNAMPAISAVPTRTGYTFTGYYDAKTGGTKYYNADKSSARTWNKTANTTLYARWSAKSFTVSFDANGATSGTPSVSSVTCSYDSACTAATQGTMLKNNSVFLGWSKTQNATSASYTSGGSIKNISTGSDVTLYAVWYKVTCTPTNGTCGTVTVGSDNKPTVTITCDTGYSKSGGANTTTSFTVTGTAGAKSLSGSCYEKCNKVTIEPYCSGSSYKPVIYKKTNTTGWYSDDACTVELTQITDLPQSCNNSNGNFTLRGVYSEKVTSLKADGNTGTQYFTKSGNTTTAGTELKLTGTKTLYLAWAKDCDNVSNGTCKLDVADDGTVDYTTSCNTGYVLGNANTNAPTCTAKCNKITLNNTTNGGTGGSTVIYKKTDLTTYYSDSACTAGNEITTVTVPSKTNATYSGTYTASGLSGGAACIDASGKLSTSTSCNVTGAKTWYARYSCSTDYRGSGTTIAGTCTGSKYTVVFNKNAADATGTMGNQSRVFADGVKLTANAFIRAGYTFDGWNTKEDGSGINYADQDAANLTGTNGATVTLYAVWKQCPAGYACNGSNVTQCTGATYAVTGSASCSSCPSGYTYNTTKGKTSAGQCQIRCAGGSYLATAKDSTCSNVGAKYYKAAHTVNYNSTSTRSACSTGLTTIGYGAGADEAGDCGRILHVDGQKLYLRSVEKTDVSLHVKIGDTVFFGNMVVGTKNMSAGTTKTLKIKHNGQTYSVYDDSVN